MRIILILLFVALPCPRRRCRGGTPYPCPAYIKKRALGPEKGPSLAQLPLSCALVQIHPPKNMRAIPNGHTPHLPTKEFTPPGGLIFKYSSIQILVHTDHLPPSTLSPACQYVLLRSRGACWRSEAPLSRACSVFVTGSTFLVVYISYGIYRISL